MTHECADVLQDEFYLLLDTFTCVQEIDCANKLEKLLDTGGSRVENDASARPPNLSQASYDLDP